VSGNGHRERVGQRRRTCLATRRLGLALLLSAVLAGPARGEESQDRIALLQAAFLYRFVGFVDWPAAESGAEGDFRVGVLGPDPFGATLDQVFAEPDGKGHRFELARAAQPDSLLHCRMVFVSLTDPQQIDAALETLRTRPILIVGHQPDFAARGGHVNFVVEGQRLRFEVNLDAVHDAGLRMSSRLLALARIVPSPGR
jgi:hypothetical protein